MMYKTYQEAKINCPEACVCLDKTSGMFFVMPSREGTTLSDDCEFAEPKDHCMSVKEFLDAGYRFEVGDALLFPNDVEQVQIVGSTACHACFIDVDAANCRSMVDHKIYILRAVALEEKPRTKVEYVKVTDSIWHLESDFNAGDLFAFDGGSDYVQVETEGDFTLSHSADNLFRRIETPMTEREAFIEAACEINEKTHGERRQYIVESLFDSGKFKLVN